MSVNLGIGLNFGGYGNYGFPSFGPSLSLGLNIPLGGQQGCYGNDGFNGSFLNEGFGSPLGGLGYGFGNPMMGLNSMGNCNPMQMMGELALLGSMSQMFGSQGCGSMFGGGGYGNYGQGGFPGQFGGYGNEGGYGFPGQQFQQGFQQGQAYGAGYEQGYEAAMNGAQGPNGVNGCGNGQGTIELQKGNSFTTPGGCTIKWDGDTVSFSDPNGGGGAQASQATQGPGPSRSFGCGCPNRNGFTGEQQGQQQNWNVYGDPHITSPDGSHQDFNNPGGMFTLSDGTKVITTAGAANSPVTSVQIVLPGAQPNWGAGGADPSKTTVYKDVNGKMTASGTANQYMMGGFGNRMG